jgi:hypothetical protein
VGIGAMTKNWEIKYEIIIHSAKISVEKQKGWERKI